MTKKVLFTRDFGAQKIKRIRDLGFDVHLICEEAFMPHSSGHSEMLDERAFNVILSNLKNLLEDKPFINEVNLQRGY